MQRDLIAVPEHWKVGQVIDYLRSSRDLADDFWEVFVVNPAHHPVGTCKLSSILRSPRSAPVTQVMLREQTLIPVELDQEDVALRFQKYALVSAAVVDPEGRLVGMITVDDVVHIIQEEAGEDVLLLSGAGDGDINEPVSESYLARVRWLIANLLTALVAASVIRFFEGSIERLAVLAVLMPIVAGVGGNAGTQTLAVTVRALATNQLTGSNRWRAVGRELRVALLNGLTIAVLIGVGVSLVLDEFALILHLSDVYWTAEGRVSVDLVSLAAACLGLALVGFSPIGVDDVGGTELAVRVGGLAVLVIHLGVLITCVLKGKYTLALIGLFVPLVALVGSLRLARPTSVWSRHLYDDRREARSRRRAQEFDRRWDPVLRRWQNLVGGRITPPVPGQTR
jgi:Mg/Co/Ni transporter MgtE